MNHTKYLLIALTATSCWHANGMVNLATGGRKLLQCVVQKTGIQELLWRHAINKIDLSCLEGQQTWLNHLMDALRNLNENNDHRIYYLMQYAAAFYAGTNHGYFDASAGVRPYGGPTYHTNPTDPYDYDALMFRAIGTALKNKIDAFHIARYFADSSYSVRMIILTMTYTRHSPRSDPNGIAAIKFLIDEDRRYESDWCEHFITQNNSDKWPQEVIDYAKSNSQPRVQAEEHPSEK